MSSGVSVRVTQLVGSRLFHSVGLYNGILIGRANSVSSGGLDLKLWTQHKYLTSQNNSYIFSLELKLITSR